jgi:hypothetical protein
MNRSPVLLTFPSEIEHAKDDVYDFCDLDLPHECISVLAHAFRGSTSHYRVVSRRQAWRSVRRFAEYLRATKDPIEHMTNPRVLVGFAEDLQRRSMRKTNGCHFNFIAMVYRWLADNGDKPIRWAAIRMPTPNFQREASRPRSNNIDGLTLKKIAAACKAEIAQTRRRLSMRGSSDAEGELSPSEAKLLRRCIELEEEGIFAKDSLRQAKVRTNDASLRSITKYKEHTTESLLPYLLLLLLATAANPSSMMDLKLNCVEDHPTDPLLRRVYWQKNRAGREQFCDVMASGTYAIPVLLRELEVATAAVRRLALPRFANHVFIARTGRHAKAPCVQGYHNALAAFRERHQLAYFTFVDVRRAIAQAIAASGQNIDAIRRVLQHASARTTDGYLHREGDIEASQRAVAAYQGQILKAATDLGREAVYETAYGFRCSDPAGGTAPGTKRGEPCLEFAQCATCPNAVFIIDSAEHVARIMVARDAIEEYGRRSATGVGGSPARCREVFGPTLAVANAILDKVHKAVRLAAADIAKGMPPYPLEE